MIQFTEQQPDHFVVGNGTCRACDLMNAHDRLSEWVAARSALAWVQQNAL